MDWLRMPMCVLRSYMTMLNRLEAKTQLDTVAATMIGTGSMLKKDADRILSEWQGVVEGPLEKKPPMTEEERKEFMRESGWFDVEDVPVG